MRLSRVALFTVILLMTVYAGVKWVQNFQQGIEVPLWVIGMALFGASSLYILGLQFIDWLKANAQK